MASHFKVHELLDGKELAELEVFAREPGRTIDECHEWLLSRGFTLCRGAVANWLSKFREQVMKERFSRSAELATALKSAIDQSSFESVADAATMQLTQVVFEQAAKLDSDGELDPLDVQRWTRSLKNLADTKAKLAERFDREVESKLKDRPNRTLTSDEVDEIRKAVFG